MLHIGAQDSHIGSDQIDKVSSAHPEIEIFVYEGADHGFNCDARASYDAPSEALARERTLGFLKMHVA
jgi:carboxymethylenebutenolidase